MAAKSGSYLVVHGRQVNLEPDMQISKAEMVGLLEGTQYHEVTHHSVRASLRFTRITLIAAPSV